TDRRRGCGSTGCRDHENERQEGPAALEAMCPWRGTCRGPAIRTQVTQRADRVDATCACSPQPDGGRFRIDHAPVLPDWMRCVQQSTGSAAAKLRPIRSWPDQDASTLPKFLVGSPFLELE